MVSWINCCFIKQLEEKLPDLRLAHHLWTIFSEFRKRINEDRNVLFPKQHLKNHKSGIFHFK